MTWNEFNRICARDLGDYYAIFATKYADGYRPTVTLRKGGHIVGWPLSAPCISRLEALRTGMRAVRSMTRRPEIETGGWRE